VQGRAGCYAWLTPNLQKKESRECPRWGAPRDCRIKIQPEDVAHQNDHPSTKGAACDDEGVDGKITVRKKRGSRLAPGHQTSRKLKTGQPRLRWTGPPLQRRMDCCYNEQ